MDLIGEFDRQAERLIEIGYPKIAGITPARFLKRLAPLKQSVANLSVPAIDFERGSLPFVIVIKRELVPTDQAMALAAKDGKAGLTKLFPLEPADFNSIDTVSIPDEPLYLLIDIDRGRRTINRAPSAALKVIQKAKRSPLTIDEGVALVTQFPDFLAKNNCFSLLASRHAGDQCVPAIWINANKHPNLGWCWDRNPHTWLGSASARERLASKRDLAIETRSASV